MTGTPKISIRLAPIRRFVRFWRACSQHQKVAISTVMSVVGVWAADRLLDFLFDSLPVWIQRWLLWSEISNFLDTYVFNLSVAVFISAFLLGVFWVQLTGWIRKMLSLFRAEFLSVFLSLVVVSGLGWIAYKIGTRNDPQIFDPVAASEVNPDGTRRVFVRDSLESVLEKANQSTVINYPIVMKPYLRKWYAVTGIVGEVTRAADGKGFITLTSQDIKQDVSLFFSEDQFQKTMHSEKGSRVFAVCMLTDAIWGILRFENCERSSPA
jgi:hypothetical protein